MKRLPSLLLFLFAGAALTAVGATHSVAVSGLTFSPSVLRITNGDTVVWSGLANFHTVTPNAGSAEPFCGNTVQSSCTVTFFANGSFGYHCNPHGGFGMTGLVTVVAASGVPPIVSITNPPNNSVFGAPATVPVGVSASDSDGNVTSVQLFTNGAVALTDAVLPFGFTLTNLVAGDYVLRARAVDNQSLSSTSAPVTVRVLASSSRIISFNRASNGPIQLQFNSVAGLNYVVERGVPLTNFIPVATNPGSGGLLQFTETNGTPSQQTYRVRVQ